MVKITVPAQPDCVYIVLGFIGEMMHKAEIDEARQSNVLIAAEEIFVNIACYAYPSAPGEVTVHTCVEADVVTVEFCDSGVPYNPLKKEDPDISRPLEERDIGGLGIFMAKRLMDTVEYRHENGMNILTLKKDTKN